MSLATTDNRVFTRGLIASVGATLQNDHSIESAIRSIAPLVFERPSICSMAVMLTDSKGTSETYRCDAGPLSEPLEALVTHQLKLATEETLGDGSTTKVVRIKLHSADDVIANVKGLLSVPFDIDAERHGQLILLTKDHALCDESELQAMSYIADLLGRAFSRHVSASHVAPNNSDQPAVAPVLYFRIEHVGAIEAVFGRENVDILFNDVIQRIERVLPCLAVIARVEDSGIAIVLSESVASTTALSELCLKACSDIVIQDKVRVQVTAQSGIESRVDNDNAFIAPQQPRTRPHKNIATA